MATVLEGFLVSLGFDIDKDEFAKFNTTVAEAGRRFMSIGKAAVGAGVAIGAAFAKSAAEVNDLYKVSNNTGTSISGLMRMQGAVERVGGSAEAVNAAFGEFATKAKTYGSSFEQMVRNQVGVSLRDATGNARDMSDVFVDISKKLAQLSRTDPGLARMKAEALGLGGIFDDIVKGDFPAELERASHFAGLFGKEIDKGANASHRMMNEISQVWDTVAAGAMSATAQITEALQLDKKLSSFNNDFADFLKSTIDSQVQIVKDASGFFDWVGKVLFKSGDYYDKSRQKVLEDRVKSGNATDEERSELKDLNKSIESNAKADAAHIDRRVMKAQGFDDDWDDTTKLKAKFFGVDTNDAEAMKDIGSRRVETEDLIEVEDDKDAYMLGLELQKRQRRADQERLYFDGSPYAKEAAAQKAAGPVDSRSTSITQTINITAPDAQAAGAAVVRETKKAAQHGNRGLV